MTLILRRGDLSSGNGLTFRTHGMGGKPGCNRLQCIHSAAKVPSLEVAKTNLGGVA